jgi:hypothetical protein
MAFTGQWPNRSAITPLQPGRRPWARVLTDDDDNGPAERESNRPKTCGKRLISPGRTPTLHLLILEVETMTTKKTEAIDAMVIRHLRGRSAPKVRVVCAWCRAVLVDVPGDLHNTSHGICQTCAAVEAARR